MTYAKLKELPAEQFRRYSGVKPETFKAMPEVLREVETAKRKPGRPSKLSNVPKKTAYYSGKKKRHALKSQLVIDYESLRILDLTQAPGPKSDLKLFQQSAVHLSAEVWCLADGGYRGLEAIHSQTVLPIREGGYLSKQDRRSGDRYGSST